MNVRGGRRLDEEHSLDHVHLEDTTVLGEVALSHAAHHHIHFY